MTLKRFLELVKEYNIPEDVILQSDSGWECSETNINAFIYLPDEKKLIGIKEADEEYLIEEKEFNIEEGREHYLTRNWVLLK